ncbi:hypothetical protein JTE90_015726 [Oedothorax gibbosus]|uniref:Reverse transcriptase n=1 Tax=Oedothorax gibbosus TaxID=931172 RepID=A0AAV6TZ73_9ARAC|nr:hypothetical protein JTE90_015726 [Oedothorax gibbosus]
MSVVRACGLRINTSKSVSMTWRVDGRNKRRVFDHRPTITVENRPNTAFGVDVSYTYLGVKFSATGRDKLKCGLRSSLDTLRRSYFLVRHLLPAFTHELTFARDSPTSFYHTSARDRGIGIPSLRWGVPIKAAQRGPEKYEHLRKYRGCERMVNTYHQVLRIFRLELWSSCDDTGLRGHSEVPQAHAWILDGSSMLTQGVRLYQP